LLDRLRFDSDGHRLRQRPQQVRHLGGPRGDFGDGNRGWGRRLRNWTGRAWCRRHRRRRLTRDGRRRREALNSERGQREKRPPKSTGGRHRALLLRHRALRRWTADTAGSVRSTALPAADPVRPPPRDPLASIGKPFLHDGHLLGFLLLVVPGDLHILQLDRHGLDLPGELEGWLVGLGDRCSLVRADVGALVSRVEAALGALYASSRDLLAVDVERPLASLAQATAVVVELVADGRLSWWHRLRGGDGIALQAEPVVGVGRLAVLQIEAPAAEPPGLSEQHPIRDAVLWDL